MRKLIIFLVMILMVFTVSASAAMPDMFSNVTADDWSYKAVSDLIQAGLIAGYETRFVNGKPTSRYEMAILIANARSNKNKASADQKAVIEKLSLEYSNELERIGAKSAQKAGKSNLDVLVVSRFLFANDSLGAKDKGGMGGTTYKTHNNYFEQQRIFLDGSIEDAFDFHARYNQEQHNINKDGSDSSLDRYYITKKNFLGGDWDIGKQMVSAGKGGFFCFSGDANGFTYSTKADRWSAAYGMYRLNFAPLESLHETTQEAIIAQIAYKPSKTSDVILWHAKNNFNDQIKDINLIGVSGAVKLSDNGVSLVAEYARNRAQSPGYNGVSGYFFGLTSNYGATAKMPDRDLDEIVNPYIQGDSGWAISYRHMPDGVAGVMNRGFNVGVPVAGDINGNYLNNFDNVNVTRFEYDYVPFKFCRLSAIAEHVNSTVGLFKNNIYMLQAAFYFK
jgi:hypothetical protein